jgi:Baseplate J-like protein
MSTCYLEVDDEITVAIKRIRAVTDGEAVLVIPPGSRIATSRINFRLLAREAAERRLNIAAVSDEPGVRALAISAGLPAYDSMATAEAALEAFREQDRQLADRVGSGARRKAAVTAPERRPSDTAVMPQPTLGLDETTVQQTGVLPAAVVNRRRRRRRRFALPLLVLLLVVVLVAGVTYGAYVFLPTATITLRPTVSHVTSPAYTITADPSVAVADPAAGVVGAQRLELPISVTGTFPATGVQVTTTAAHGTVRFRSENTLNAVPVPSGTIVSTGDGIEFETTEAVTVPKANFNTGTRGTAIAHIKASVDGPRGNVAAGTISKLPAGLAAQLLTVTNPDPTDGGARDEQTIVQQSDYDAAYASLSGQLPAVTAGALEDTANIPRGLTVYSATSTMGDTQADPTPVAVVGTAAASFSLTLHSSVSVIAVNESLVDDLGKSRFRSSLAADQQIVGDAVSVAHGTGSVVGDTIVFQVTAAADVYMQPDEQQVVAAISGKSVSDARQALAQYGDAEIQMWPQFIDHLPDQAARIRLTVVPPQPSS